MPISPQTNKFLHSKLPIDDDENIIGIYKHHWFAYASIWIVGVVIVIIIMSLASILTMVGDNQSVLVQHRSELMAIALVFSVLVLLGTFLPVYLRGQEQVVLTEEALLQVLQPSLFSNKIDQVSLQHITDVSVHQDFFGTILGYGSITVETPGEQNNYRFYMLPNPQECAKEIISAHENFDAALQGGHMPTTLGGAKARMEIDPQQYQQFLQYQQMLAQQQRDQIAQTNDPTGTQSRSDDQDQV